MTYCVSYLSFANMFRQLLIMSPRLIFTTKPNQPGMSVKRTSELEGTRNKKVLSGQLVGLTSWAFSSRKHFLYLSRDCVLDLGSVEQA